MRWRTARRNAWCRDPTERSGNRLRESSPLSPRPWTSRGRGLSFPHPALETRSPRDGLQKEASHLLGGDEAAERRLTAEYVTARALVESHTLAEATPKILQGICEALG